MGTIADKLEYTMESKEGIREAIIDKGVPCPGDTELMSYADLIEQISSGITPEELEAAIEAYFVAHPIDAYTKQQADDKFVEDEEGKGLSANDYTDADKAKVVALQDWALAETKPAYTASEVGAVAINSGIDISIGNSKVNMDSYGVNCKKGDSESELTYSSFEFAETHNGQRYKQEIVHSAITQNTTVYLPAQSGTLAVTADIPNVPSWALSETKPTYTATEVGALPDTTVIPTKLSDLTDDVVSGKYQPLNSNNGIAVNANKVYTIAQFNRKNADNTTVPGPIIGASLPTTSAEGYSEIALGNNTVCDKDATNKGQYGRAIFYGTNNAPTVLRNKNKTDTSWAFVELPTKSGTLALQEECASGDDVAINLIPYPYYHSDGRVRYGITYNESNGVITANGTVESSASGFYLLSQDNPFHLTAGKTYRLSGCPTGGGSETYRLTMYKANSSSTLIGSDTGSGFLYTPTVDVDITIRVIIAPGTTVENLVFKPMLEVSNDYHTYVEYAGDGEAINDVVATLYKSVSSLSEVCPKNLLIYPYYQTTREANNAKITDNGDGTLTITTSGSVSATTTLTIFDNRTTSQPMLCEKDKIYRLSWNLPQASYRRSGLYVALRFYNSSKGIVKTYAIYEDVPFVDVQVPETAVYMSCWLNIPSSYTDTDVLVKPMLIEGTAAYDYKPFINDGDVYCLAERSVGRWIDGQEMYQKTFIITLDSTVGFRNVSVPATEGITELVDVHAVWKPTNGKIAVLPYINPTNDAGKILTDTMDFISDSPSIGVYTGLNRSGHKIYVTVRYLK